MSTKPIIPESVVSALGVLVVVSELADRIDALTAERDALAEKLRQITDEAPGYVLAEQITDDKHTFLRSRSAIHDTLTSAQQVAHGWVPEPQVYALVPVVTA